MPRTKKNAAGPAPPAPVPDTDSAEDARAPPPDTDSAQDALARIPGSVVGKLVAFSVLLLVVPLLAYFASLRLVFGGSTTPAAITAAVSANLVLAAYVYVAWTEESAGAPKRKTE
ncbi:vacuolar ATPase assembly integral membrane protein vma21 [Coemansia javaensis]|uniref:Vacuolar ATPase assembly integral membrane protein vma21 n=1 Tax=Coemansia javaensis TaxID=2761396 RepID=A0A9W8LJC4_9FUNG|nr:vacuolar ATPase assembly integral membrane protein vma21 [Coemansia javaensis]